MDTDILSAMIWANIKHSAIRQVRSTILDGVSTKEPYFNHLLRVMHKVSSYTESKSAHIAAILHDIVEDTDVLISDVEEKFGSEVSSYVSQLTLPPNLIKGDHFRKRFIQVDAMLSATSDDVRIIKVADKIDNITASSVWAPHVQIGYAISAEYVVHAALDSSDDTNVSKICSEFDALMKVIRNNPSFDEHYSADTFGWNHWLRGNT